MSKEESLDPQLKVATWLSIFTAVALFSIKFAAFQMTGSQAIFSEAMESIVNVFAAIIAFFVIIYAVKPADRDHPYGHGKVEYLSAAVEGGLIAFAAVIIVIEAVQAFYEKRQVRSLDIGLTLLAFTGVINLVVGAYLSRLGKRKHSAALEASGKHLVADFWTSAGVIVGLFLVYLTGIMWLDIFIAILVSLHLMKEGYSLVKKSIGGLLDQEEVEVLNQIKSLVNQHRMDGMLQVHHVRVLRSGKYHHIDAHLVVPEFWTIEQTHDRSIQYERLLFKNYEFSGEFHFHMDPCRKLYCEFCNIKDCPIRLEEFKGFRDMSLNEIRHNDEPDEVTVKLKK